MQTDPPDPWSFFDQSISRVLTDLTDANRVSLVRIGQFRVTHNKKTDLFREPVLGSVKSVVSFHCQRRTLFKMVPSDLVRDGQQTLDPPDLRNVSNLQ